MAAVREIPFPRKCRYALETAAAYIVYGLFRLLPVETSSNLGGFIMRWIGPHMGITRTALRNLDLAFPEKTAAEQRAIVMEMWDNLGRVIGEYPHLRRIAPRVEVVGGEHLDAVQASGAAALFFSAHLSNWEVGALVARRHGVDITLVYRRPNNPWVDGLLRHARDSGGAGHVAKGKGAARDILSILKTGGTVGMLMDQKMNEGLPIPFFGRDAMTAPALALFALARGCPVHPWRAERTGPAKFRVTIFPPLAIRDTGDKDADVRRILEQVNAEMEGWIRARPGEWLWIHRRWPQ
jgi:KDO2-lipid IV(A) lauroyltransferase